MKKIHTSTTWIFVLVLSYLLYGCGSGGNDDDDAAWSNDYYTETQNILFYGTWEIPLEITPKVSQPSFACDATGLKYFVVTIFDSRIDLRDNRISNPEDAVWTWNTGLGKGREGNLTFSDGRNVVNGAIQDTVTPLSPGTYYIAAWGYDDEYNLIYSSKEYQHHSH